MKKDRISEEDVEIVLASRALRFRVGLVAASELATVTPFTLAGAAKLAGPAVPVQYKGAKGHPFRPRGSKALDGGPQATPPQRYPNAV